MSSKQLERFKLGNTMRDFTEIDDVTIVRNWDAVADALGIDGDTERGRRELDALSGVWLTHHNSADLTMRAIAGKVAKRAAIIRQHGSDSVTGSAGMLTGGLGSEDSSDARHGADAGWLASATEAPADDTFDPTASMQWATFQEAFLQALQDCAESRQYVRDNIGRKGVANRVPARLARMAADPAALAETLELMASVIRSDSRKGNASTMTPVERSYLASDRLGLIEVLRCVMPERVAMMERACVKNGGRRALRDDKHGRKVALRGSAGGWMN